MGSSCAIGGCLVCLSVSKFSALTPAITKGEGEALQLLSAVFTLRLAGNLRLLKSSVSLCAESSEGGTYLVFSL